MEPQRGLPPPRPPLAYTLHPGDVACVERGDCLETLLGSCVAVVLTDPRRSIGAMCHIVHSSPAPHRAEHPETHADAALQAMYAQLRARGYQHRLCHAFVYGGGNMFPGLFTKSHVGTVNGRFVLERLQRDGVTVLFHDLGGATYRKLSWTVGPGMPRVVAVDVTANDG
jgi:chemotaxis protein CheD